MPPFQSASDKLWQAQIHVETLWQAIRAFEKARAYEVVGHNNPDGWYSDRLHIRMEPPIELPLIAGDAIHNARSALDHAIYEITTARGKDRERVFFPLYPNRVKYVEAKRNGRWEIALKGVDPKYRALVEREQPFRRGNRRLGPLADFDNRDKHRVVHASFAAATRPPSFRVQPPSFMSKLEFRAWPAGKRMHEGTEVWAWRRRPSAPRDHGVGRVGVNVNYAITVAFGKRNLTKESIQDLVNSVGEVLRDMMTIRAGRPIPLEARRMDGGVFVMAPGAGLRTHLLGPLVTRVYGDPAQTPS